MNYVELYIIHLPESHDNHTAFGGDNRTGLPDGFRPVGSSNWPCFDV